MKVINKNTWIRKEHFDFFSKFDEPFFGIVSEVDCTKAFQFTKKENISFFAFYLYKSLVAVNNIEELKYRIKNELIVQYDKINASPTIGREDGTFALSYVKYNSDFNVFNKSLLSEINEVNNSSGLRLAPNDSKILDVIHYSSIPWIKFTGLSHARNFKYVDSCPKITFGKTHRNDNKLLMPVSVNAHHGLVDGKHIGNYFELFQELLNE
jgi:chloramphenicol O-acetyltransferase type A